jgi:hypothetical protein
VLFPVWRTPVTAVTGITLAAWANADAASRDSGVITVKIIIHDVNSHGRAPKHAAPSRSSFSLERQRITGTHETVPRNAAEAIKPEKRRFGS